MRSFPHIHCKTLVYYYVLLLPWRTNEKQAAIKW